MGQDNKLEITYNKGSKNRQFRCLGCMKMNGGFEDKFELVAAGWKRTTAPLILL